MPTVQDILDRKGSLVHTIEASASVLDAIHLMNEEQVGAVLVMKDGRVAGIFTERDVLRRVIAQEQSPAAMRITDAMTNDVVCCPPDADLDEASRIMRDRRIRHLPICDDDGRASGMISIGDLNAYHASQQEAQLTFLNDYVYGRA
jgi:CBS domain-containing protein